MIVALLTVEEANDVREIHAILKDDLSIIFHHSQCDEENERAAGNMLCCPDRLPHLRDRWKVAKSFSCVQSSEN